MASLTTYKTYKWIVKDPNYLNGNLAVKDTRLPIYLILQCLADGMSYDEIQKTYTKFPKEALAEVLRVAAEVVQEKNVAV